MPIQLRARRPFEELLSHRPESSLRRPAAVPPSIPALGHSSHLPSPPEVSSCPQPAVLGAKGNWMKRSRDRRFFKVLLPLFVTANLGLGLLVLAQLGPHEWQQWLGVGPGGVCCAVAGWLAGSGWAASCWGGTKTEQWGVV